MIRAAALADTGALAAVEAQCFGADAWSAGLVEQEIAGATRRVLLAYDVAAVCGYGSIMVAGDSADLHRVAVVPRWRRQGHARALLDALLAAAADGGATHMLLEVAADNAPALGLYHAAGFGPIGRRRRYYADGTDALVLRRELTAGAAPSCSP